MSFDGDQSMVIVTWFSVCPCICASCANQDNGRSCLEIHLAEIGRGYDIAVLVPPASFARAAVQCLETVAGAFRGNTIPR